MTAVFSGNDIPDSTSLAQTLCSLSVYMCVSVCLCVCVFVHLCVCVWVCVWGFACMNVCVRRWYSNIYAFVQHICVYVCMCVCVLHLFVCVRVRARTCVCVCVGGTCVRVCVICANKGGIVMGPGSIRGWKARKSNLLRIDKPHTHSHKCTHTNTRAHN